MNNTEVVKNSIIVNKISEYFAKNPDKTSVVVKADLGENKLFWRAVREGVSTFRVTEVKTSTSSFMCEVKMPKQKMAPDPERKDKKKKKKDKNVPPKSKKFINGRPKGVDACDEE